MLFLNLKNFWHGIKKDYLLLLILFFGLLLRGLNPTFGSPSLYVSNDEAIAHLSALNMISSKTLVSISNYTPFGAYIQIPFLMGIFLVMMILGLVNSTADFALFLLTHQGYFLFIPRLISALFGTLTIIVIYKITYRLYFNKRTALIAAFLCAVSFNLVHISHFGRPWAPALFFFTLSVYFALKKKLFLSYFAIVLSFGFHQIGLLALPLVFWLSEKRFNFKNLFGLFLLAVTIFTLNNLTFKTGLIDAISRDQSFLKQGKFAADLITGEQDLVSSFFRSIKDNLSIYFLKNLFTTDTVLLLGVAGVIFSFIKRISNTKNIVIYIVVYFFIASLVFHPLIRYLLPIIILVIPFVAFIISTLTKNNRLLLVFVLFFASLNSLWWNSIFLKKPTFILAQEWIANNLPKEIPVAYIGGRYQTFAPSIEAINEVQNVNKNYAKALQSILPVDYFNNVRNMLYVSNFPGRTKLDQLESATSNYSVYLVIDYYIDPKERLYNLAPDRFIILRQFNPTIEGVTVGISEPLFDASWNFPTNDNRKKISMYSLSNTGPYVDILKVKRY